MTRIDHGIYALQYARRTASTRGEHFYGHDADCGGHYPIDYFVWAICRPKEVIVIDGGFTRETARQRGNRDYLADPVDLLGMLGRSADEVSHLVLSHLHYDHTGHLDAFRLGLLGDHRRNRIIRYGSEMLLRKHHAVDPITGEPLRHDVRRKPFWDIYPPANDDPDLVSVADQVLFNRTSLLHKRSHWTQPDLTTQAFPLKVGELSISEVRDRRVVALSSLLNNETRAGK